MAAPHKVEKGQLVLEGIPPTPTEISESLLPYQNSRPAYACGWIQSTSEILIQTRFAETLQIHHVQKPGGCRKQITFFSERVATCFPCPISSSPFSSTFIFSKDQGGDEKWQLFLFDLKTGKHQLLTDGRSRNGALCWSHDGTQIAYYSTKRNGKNMDVFIQPLSGGPAICLHETNEEATWHPNSFSPNGKYLLMKRNISLMICELFIIDLETKEEKKINPKEQEISYGSISWKKDSSGFFVSSTEDSEFKNLRFFDIKTFTISESLSSDIAWDLEDIEVSNDGTKLAFITNEDGINILRVKNLLTNEIEKLKIPQGQVGSIHWRPNDESILFDSTSPISPSKILEYFLITKEIVCWVEPEVGSLNTENFVDADLIKWDTFDTLPETNEKRQISGFYYKPKKRKDNEKFPCIVTIHGGPESQAVPTWIWKYQYWLGELGIAIIAPNVRGSSGYGKTFITLDDGFKREDSVKDIGCLLEWIKQQPEIDQNRVLVDGGSYGVQGYMVLASMIHFGDFFIGGMERVGISNFVTFLENTGEYRVNMRRKEYGDETAPEMRTLDFFFNMRRKEYGDERNPEMREFLMKVSPLTNVHKIAKPMFVVQGLNDPRVPVTESEQIVSEIRKNGVECWYMLGKDEGHGFSKKSNIDEMTRAEVMFLKKFLLKEEI